MLRDSSRSLLRKIENHTYFFAQLGLLVPLERLSNGTGRKQKRDSCLHVTESAAKVDVLVALRGLQKHDC
jgi:hypothetical protein